MRTGDASAEAAAAPPRAAQVPARAITPMLALPGFLGLLVALYVGLFLRLGAIPLFDVDEGAFAEATREMLARGDFVSTWLNGQPRFDKPILIYWLQAASVSVLGWSEFALRLPSSLASCAWVGAIYVFTRRYADHATGLAAGFIAVTSAGVTVIGRAAIADALLNLFLALAMFDIIRYLAAPEPESGLRRRVFLWIGLGLLTKGPVALLVPGAASVLACALLGRLRAWWAALRDPLGWLILLAVAAPWYVLEYARRGDAFVAGFFMRHNVERVLAPLQGHGGSLLYYVPAVLLLLLPYSGLFLATLPGPRGLSRLRQWRRMAQDNPVDTFLWCWFVFVFVFFSVASTKLPHYLLYGATPLFVLMARRRERLRAGWLAFGPALLFLGAVLALPFALRHAAPIVHNPYIREALGRPGAFDRTWLGVAALLFGAVLGLAAWRRAPSWPRLAAAGLACACATVTLLLPALAELQQGPVKEAAVLARSQGWQVRSWRINAPSFSVYRGALTPGVSAPAAGMVILTRSDALPALGPALDSGRVLYRKGGVVLLRIPG
jgi:4-amino-4-deoxy-L-arabinose transferase-like glycosyltransferase